LRDYKKFAFNAFGLSFGGRPGFRHPKMFRTDKVPGNYTMDFAKYILIDIHTDSSGTVITTFCLLHWYIPLQNPLILPIAGVSKPDIQKGTFPQTRKPGLRNTPAFPASAGTFHNLF
jgi:hypothetical protein